jgi:FKBP-type peptidyl-prolyl cis-trans isomerase (trigger factor)
MQKYIILAGTLLAITLLSGCIGDTVTGGSTYNMEQKPIDGNIVSVDYWLTVDGEQIDTSEGRGAFQFTVGAGEVIPGFDKAVKNLAVGETKDVVLTGNDAYTNGPLAGKELHFKIKLLAIN